MRKDATDVHVAAAARESAPHTDRYAHNAHELPESAAEAVSRSVIRLVPLAYGVLLGVLIDSLLLGLLAGGALSIVLDLFMGGQSLLRAAYRNLATRLCPMLAVLAHTLAAAAAGVGVDRLGALRRLRCAAKASPTP